LNLPIETNNLTVIADFIGTSFKMLDVNSLYPVVHDLTDAEYSAGCCNEFVTFASFCPVSRSSVTKNQDVVTVTPNTSPIAVLQDTSAPHTTTISSSGSENSLRQSGHSEILSAIIEDEEGSRTPPTFANTYVLTRQISAGTFATVWETIERTSGHCYATKIYHRRSLSQENEDKVYKEANMLNQLRQSSSAGIVPLVDFFDEPNQLYLVTEYAQGGNLLSLLVDKQQQRRQRHRHHHQQQSRRESDCSSEKESRDIARSLLKGLHHMHTIGICHRNLTPEHILFRDLPVDDKVGGSVQIAGFGLAAQICGHVPSKDDSISNKGSDLLKGKVGTASYVAPEVLKGSPYDTQADMWSMGVILYVIMAGSLPFVDHHSKQGLFRKICKGEYIFDTRDWSYVSPLAKDFVFRLLQVNPQVRMSAEDAMLHPWVATAMKGRETEIVHDTILESESLSESSQEMIHVEQGSSISDSTSTGTSTSRGTFKEKAYKKRLRRVWWTLSSKIRKKKEEREASYQDTSSSTTFDQMSVASSSTEGSDTVDASAPYHIRTHCNIVAACDS